MLYPLWTAKPGAGCSVISVALATRLASRIDGGVVLIDRQSASLIEYAPDGTVRRTLGRKGEGPGEFVAPSDLVVLPGDRVSVYDPRTARLTTFAPGDSAPEIRTLSAPSSGQLPRSVWPLPGGAMSTLAAARIEDRLLAARGQHGARGHRRLFGR